MSEAVMRRLAKPLLFLAAFIWGTSFFIMKNTLDAVPPSGFWSFGSPPARCCWGCSAGRSGGPTSPGTTCGGAGSSGYSSLSPTPPRPSA